MSVWTESEDMGTKQALHIALIHFFKDKECVKW